LARPPAPNDYRASGLRGRARRIALAAFRDINLADVQPRLLALAKARELQKIGIYTPQDDVVEFDLEKGYLYLRRFVIELDDANLAKRLKHDLRWKRFFSALSITAVLSGHVRLSDYVEVNAALMGRDFVYVDLRCRADSVYDLFKSCGDKLSFGDAMDLVKRMSEALARVVRKELKKLREELKNDYRKLTSDEAVIETLNAERYQFTRAGCKINQAHF
jgi:hypothetical protein